MQYHNKMDLMRKRKVDCFAYLTKTGDKPCVGALSMALCKLATRICVPTPTYKSELSRRVAGGASIDDVVSLKPWAMSMAIFIHLSQENWAASPPYKGRKQMRSNLQHTENANI